MTNATPLNQQVRMLSQDALLARVVLGSCAAVKGRLRLWNAKETERQGAHLANLLLIYLSHLFSLDLCKLVFMSITGICFPLLKNRAIA